MGPVGAVLMVFGSLWVASFWCQDGVIAGLQDGAYCWVKVEILMGFMVVL